MSTIRGRAQALRSNNQHAAPARSGQACDTAFAAVLREVLDRTAELDDADSPRTIDDWDSLVHIRLLNALETRFGVRLPDEALFEEHSIGSLKALVLERAEPDREPGSSVEITELKTDAEIDQYYRLRYDRLRKPLGLELGSERDDPAETNSIHVVAKLEDRVIAAGCWVVGSRKDEASGKRVMFVRFRQLAVDREFEARGAGGRMMRHVESEARRVGAAEMVANVRQENVEYFTRHGWIELGEGVALYGQVQSRSMVKPLR